MTVVLRNALWALCVLILIGCASHGIPRWRYFQGDLPGHGYIPVESGFALSSAWTSGPYNIATSSPVGPGSSLFRHSGRRAGGS
jgi:hypothetical protein